MKVFVPCEGRFSVLPNGAVYAHNPVLTYKFWSRYLDVFDAALVSIRAFYTEHAPSNLPRADGPGIEFLPLPYFDGPWQYLLTRQRVRNILASVEPTYAVCMRVPTLVATEFFWATHPSGRPFGAEIVADIWDAFAPGTSRNYVFRPLFRRVARRNMELICGHACAVAYVTQRTLQQRYPPNPRSHITHFSSIDLTDDAFVQKPRTDFQSAKRLVCVGTMGPSLYKGQDILLKALALCQQSFPEIELTLIGSGPRQAELVQLADELGLKQCVRFTGQLSGTEAVRRELDKSDLFVLPSLTEGLPKALIEAMARGIPCIGSTAGGIPELLPSEDLVPPGNVRALFERIVQVLSDPERMSRMAARNLEKARAYRIDAIRPCRIAYYTAVKEATQAWLSRSL